MENTRTDGVVNKVRIFIYSLAIKSFILRSSPHYIMRRVIDQIFVLAELYFALLDEGLLSNTYLVEI